MAEITQEELTKLAKIAGFDVKGKGTVGVWFQNPTNQGDYFIPVSDQLVKFAQLIQDYAVPNEPEVGWRYRKHNPDTGWYSPWKIADEDTDLETLKQVCFESDGHQIEVEKLFTQDQIIKLEKQNAAKSIAISGARTLVKHLESMIVMNFEPEDLHPYVQGFNQHEQCSPLAAVQVNRLHDRIAELSKDAERYHKIKNFMHVDPDAYDSEYKAIPGLCIAYDRLCEAAYIEAWGEQSEMIDAAIDTLPAIDAAISAREGE